MQIQKNKSLKEYNTFGIDVLANQFVTITDEKHIATVLKQNISKPLFVLSGGSNILLTKNIEALVMHINIKGIVVNKHQDYALVTAKGGENWHNFVQFCVSNNLGGLENLSLIPGYVGSAPIQNIGAYGVELKDCFESCKAINRTTLETVKFLNKDCEFGYRSSIFKNKVKNQFIITEVTFRLSIKNHKLRTGYGAIEEQLALSSITAPTIQDVANAIIKIRKNKLPNPSEIGNSGSFFKNPIISKKTYQELLKKYPEMPNYIINEAAVKIPAGWLIEQAGFKGYVHKNAGVHKNQALVLINKTGNAKGKEILELAELIQVKILELYGIKLEAEVNII